jgi:hypothetical protein
MVRISYALSGAILLLCTAPAFSQAFIASSHTSIGTASPATVPRPSSVATGDLLVVGLMVEKGSNEVISPPAGWTLIRRADNGSNIGMATYFKFAGASEPSSYSFTLSNGSKWSTGIVRIINGNLTDPVGASAAQTGGSGSATAPGITTTTTNTLILAFYSNKKDAYFTPHSSTAEVFDAPNIAQGQPSNMLAHRLQTTAATTSGLAATPSISEKWVSMQFAINAEDRALPVELMAFSAHSCGSNVCVDWSTATEYNNDSFFVERSANGTDWDSVAEVQGAGTTQTVTHYSARDLTPLFGKAYYRLRQVDHDQSTSYSDVVVVKHVKMETDLLVYPNPSRDIFTVHIPISAPLQVFDLQHDITRAIRIHRQDDRSTLDLSSLPSGTYIIRSGNEYGVIWKL